MPKVHNIGKNWFTQILKDYRVQWGWKVAVKGWTQEIEEPFRTSTPLIVRLPSHKALVLGRWSGAISEEEALNKAVQRRDLTDDDFSEEKGWVPVPDKDSEEGWYDIYSRTGDLG